MCVVEFTEEERKSQWVLRHRKCVFINTKYSHAKYAPFLYLFGFLCSRVNAWLSGEPESGAFLPRCVILGLRSRESYKPF